MSMGHVKDKLTLWLDKETIDFGKRFAKGQNKSLSELLKDYLQGLRRNGKVKAQVTETVKRMTGVVKNKKVDEKEYLRHLEKKYLHA